MPEPGVPAKLRIVLLVIGAEKPLSRMPVLAQSMMTLLNSEPAALTTTPVQLPRVGEAALDVSVMGEADVPAIFSAPLTVSEAPLANFSVVPGCRTSFAPAATVSVVLI